MNTENISDGSILERAKNECLNYMCLLKLQKQRIQNEQKLQGSNIGAFQGPLSIQKNGEIEDDLGDALSNSKPFNPQFMQQIFYDFQVFILAVNRLRQTVKLAEIISNEKIRLGIEKTRKAFDAKFMHLVKLRDVGEHYPDYAIGNSNNKHKSVSREQLNVMEYEGSKFKWLGETVNLDDLIAECNKLYDAISAALSLYVKQKK